MKIAGCCDAIRASTARHARGLVLGGTGDGHQAIEGGIAPARKIGRSAWCADWHDQLCTSEVGVGSCTAELIQTSN